LTLASSRRYIGLITIWRQVVLQSWQWFLISIRLEEGGLPIALSFEVANLELSCTHVIGGILLLLINNAVKERASASPAYRWWPCHRVRTTHMAETSTASSGVAVHLQGGQLIL
jgi:hypothetical protein